MGWWDSWTGWYRASPAQIGRSTDASRSFIAAMLGHTSASDQHVRGQHPPREHPEQSQAPGRAGPAGQTRLDNSSGPSRERSGADATTSFACRPITRPASRSMASRRMSSCWSTVSGVRRLAGSRMMPSGAANATSSGRRLAVRASRTTLADSGSTPRRMPASPAASNKGSRLCRRSDHADNSVLPEWARHMFSGSRAPVHTVTTRAPSPRARPMSRTACWDGSCWTCRRRWEYPARHCRKRYAQP